jgi:glycosyltransferase involved in cell wall biosynthesis
MKKLPISVYFIASNEEERIATALASVESFADEIIVVIDEKCNDNTAKIAESYGAKVIVNPWKGFAYQKAFATKQCKNDWVLNLDADEEVSSALIDKLRELFSDKKLPDYAGFLMTWVVLYPGQIKPSKHAHVDYIIRLYNKNKAAIKEVEFLNDDRPKIHTGEVGRIKEPVYHRTILNFSHLEKKNMQYSKEHAMNNVYKGRKISTLKFYTDFPLKFLKYYFLRKMCLHGWYGFTLSIMAAYRNFMRLAKTRELYAIKESEKSK